MDVLHMLTGFSAGETKIIEEAMPDGTVRSIHGVRRSGQPSLFEVRLRLDGDQTERTVFSSLHEDEAAHIYGCIDGAPRAWAAAWLPRGLNGSDAERRIMHRVFAAGATPEACVTGFADSLGTVLDAGTLSVDVSDGEWQARFSAGGTSFKAGGYLVPGGAIMASWK